MKKLIAVILSAVIALSCLSFSAFAEEEPVDYVILGDSIAFGAGMVNTVGACYGKIVADTNGYTYTNHSIPGITSGVLLTMVTDGEKIRASVEKAEIISISIGGNNYLTNNMVALAVDCLVTKDMERFDRIAEVYYNELSQIIATIKELNPDAVILLQTLYNPQDGAAGIVYGLGGDKINEMIRKYDAEHPGDIVIVEVGEALNGNSANFADDKLHPSVAGNEEIAYAVLDVLYDLGLGENTEPVITTPGLDLLMPVSYALLIDIACSLLDSLGKLVNPV